MRTVKSRAKLSRMLKAFVCFVTVLLLISCGQTSYEIVIENGSVSAGTVHEDAAAVSSAAAAINATTAVPEVAPQAPPANTAGERLDTDDGQTIKAIIPKSSDEPALQPSSAHRQEDSALPAIMDDDEPLVDVPPLPKRNGSKTNHEMHQTSASDEANESS